ncbi:MAG TPA: glycosyltransferase family 4 protein [Acidimicrobiales bacterium]|nr:glycosyltransferase family 4 protein [Acidimicrobiales bacterium]
MLAPPWLPVPPSGYGGVESVISLITGELVERGHDVTLFAAPGSLSAAAVCHVLPEAHPDEIERALYEADHVARVFAFLDQAADRGLAFDIVHDHCGFTGVAMADRIDVPMVHTLHGPFTPGTGQFYQEHGHKALLVAISEAQRSSAPEGVAVASVVPNPVDLDDWPFEPYKQDYLVWLGRMHETKGPHRAIQAAREAGCPLVLAGPVQPGQEAFFRESVAPHIDGKAVRYVGEIGGKVKADLLAGARALLMPIRWNEPFGMVMVEALACGTPVISFDEGAACEVVRDGVTGFLVKDEAAMAEAVSAVHSLDARDCRADVAARFGVERVTAAYEHLYRATAMVSNGPPLSSALVAEVLEGPAA